ncbi:MAG: hypothetical protein JWM62_2097, partial [Frankiales bacterium]|nr:hypothetical protein [Frankiales bacterium]
MITSKRSVKRAAAGVSAGLLVLSGIAGVATTAAADEDFQFERLAGTDRYGTASDIATETFQTAGTVVIASGGARNFPDALAGNYLAGALNAPILLTPNTSLAQSTRDAITQLGAQRAVIVGGTSAVSASVEAQLEALNGGSFTVTREAGTDRYLTAVEVAKAANTAQIGSLEGKGRTAILASGEDFADALAAGPVSFAQRVPVLLTGSGGLNSATSAALDDLNIQHVVVVGGTARITNAAVTDAQSGDDGARTSTRIAGQTRQATSVLIADYARANAGF